MLVLLPNSLDLIESYLLALSVATIELIMLIRVVVNACLLSTGGKC